MRKAHWLAIILEISSVEAQLSLYEGYASQVVEFD